MNLAARTAFCLATLSTSLPTARGADADAPAAPNRPKLEFRWLEDEPIKGVTLAEGVQTTCRTDVSYPHRSAVLTAKAVAEARLTHLNLGGSDQYLVDFQLTKE